MCPATPQNPPYWNTSWLNNACATRKDPESEWLAKDNPEINPTSIKCETTSHMEEQPSWVPLPSCSPPEHPFPVKSLAWLVHVSLQTIHFRVLDKSPYLGPGNDPPSRNTFLSPFPHSLISNFSSLLFGAQWSSRRSGLFLQTRNMEPRKALTLECPLGVLLVPFSLLLFNPKVNKGEKRKEIKFWIESLIINLARELSFRGTQFQITLESVIEL